MTTPRSSAAQAETGNEELAGDDRGDHPPREDPTSHKDDQDGQHEQLVGNGVEEGAQR
jgi:hypothetical protein